MRGILNTPRKYPLILTFSRREKEPHWLRYGRGFHFVRRSKTLIACIMKAAGILLFLFLRKGICLNLEHVTSNRIF